MAEASARSRSPARIPALNVILFLATIASTLWAGASQTLVARPALSGWQLGQLIESLRAVAVAGLPFATALIGILLSHEMGHYLLARAHGVDSTLPYFIPFPLSEVGTLGAVIRIRSPIPSRTAVLDIGSAGPFAGFVVALPLLAWGLAHSEVRPVGDAWQGGVGMGALQWLHAYVTTGHWPQSLGARFYGDSLVTWGMQRIVLGKLPPGTEVFAHPVALAALFGLLVTALNLFPIGQLDGGHVTYALFGRARARAISRLVSGALFACGLFFSWTWFVWWALTRFLVRFDHPPAQDEQPLDGKRRALAVLALVLFAVTFVPVPISL